MRAINLGTEDGLPELDWTGVAEKLEKSAQPDADAVNAYSTWLTTLNDDGSAHVTAVGALWVDGAFWFQTGAATLKARNVARDPRCVVAVSVREADVVVEGDAARVTDADTLMRIAQAYADTGWPAEIHESGTGITAPYNAPGLGPAPWNVYRIDPRTATVVANVEPGGLTRFVF